MQSFTYSPLVLMGSLWADRWIGDSKSSLGVNECVNVGVPASLLWAGVLISALVSGVLINIPAYPYTIGSGSPMTL